MSQLLTKKIIMNVNNVVEIFAKKLKESHNIDVIEMWYDTIGEERSITDKITSYNKISPIAKSKKVSKEKVVTKIKEKKGKYQNKPVLSNIVKNTPIIQIRRNKYGNYEHEPTNLIFDKDEKIVIGKQENENIIELTEEDIESCKKFKFNYKLPENLDKGKVTKNIKIDDYSIDDDTTENYIENSEDEDDNEDDDNEDEEEEIEYD